MAKAAYEGPEEALALYQAAVEAAGLERKGAKSPYTSRNGHMYSFLDPTGAMAIRLSAEVGEEFKVDYESGPVEQYGRTMRGYVSVPPALLANPDELATWIQTSHEWIGTLKPK